MTTSRVNLKEKIIPAFHKAWRAYDDKQYLHIYEKGGRGSSKSTTICMKLVYNRMRRKSHAVCVRKYAKTLRHSVRNQVIWAIHHMGVQDSFQWSDAPSGDMTITYTPTGAKIFFEGADGDKIKGWKTYDMPTTDIFFEEITDFATDEELSSIKLSILREVLPEGFKYTFFHAHNPPKRKSHWVNKRCESSTLPANAYVNHTDYLCNPYLPPEFHIEADHIKEVNRRRYDWEYLGQPIGSGIVPFDNLKFKTITNEQVESFDNLKAGNDWGYSVDPNAWVLWHYDKTRRLIYAVDEIYGVKLTLDELARKIKVKGYERIRTICDSAEPRSINEMKRNGCNFVPAKKGPGSVEHGVKWLDELEGIIIDPTRTPNIAKDFESADYAVDKDGNTLTKLHDVDDHAIDGTRYALEDEMKGLGKLKAVTGLY